MFYLVQRMNAREASEGNSTPSFDDLFGMDYMGSAEFEFGALPKSLKRICRDLDSYATYTLTQFKRPETDEAIRIFCKPEQMQEITEGIELLLESDYPRDLRSKEHIGLFAAFTNSESKFYQTDAWWDIDYDFFFTIGKQNMKNIQKAIQNTATKHKIDWDLG